MPFDQIESLATVKQAHLAASVALVATAQGLPRCRITLSQEFAAASLIKSGDRFDLLLGTGADKRLLRLRRNKNGIVAAITFGRAKCILLSLGHIGRFGTEPEKRERCRAQLIDADVIQITLPAWANK